MPASAGDTTSIVSRSTRSRRTTRHHHLDASLPSVSGKGRLRLYHSATIHTKEMAEVVFTIGNLELHFPLGVANERRFLHLQSAVAERGLPKEVRRVEVVINENHPSALENDLLESSTTER